MRLTLILPFAAAVTLATGKVSTNSRCGHAYDASPKDMTCKGSQWGDCCSQYGYCGKTKDYCGAGCQSSFGTCNFVAPAQTSKTSSRIIITSIQTAPSTVPSSAPVKIKVTTNARCGNLYGASPAGMTCSGGKYGDCCSQYSYCGSSSAYCGTGCQPGFGKCDASSPESSQTFTSATSSSASPYSSSSSSSSSVILVSSTPSAEVSSTLTSTSASSIEISSMTTISSTPAPSPNAGKFCGVEGYDTVDLQVISSKPFTTLDACLSECKAQSACSSFIIYSNTCYFTRVPITSTNVTPQSGSGLVFYNVDCGDNTSAETTTAPPTMSETPTSTSSSITSSTSVCVPPAPTVSCVKYPDCQKFTAGLSNSCPSYAAQCQDNYFVRCGDTGASGSQAIDTLPGTASVDMCRQQCDSHDDCSAFSYQDSTCTLWRYLNGFISAPTSNTFIRICPVTTCSNAPNRRDTPGGFSSTTLKIKQGELS
ncbi:hypothetical protein B5807_02194 [Epicoccum nigrum]|uniref:Chitin-binding type-1 domain-containing protein n=1 Tax=Epicoccum nigrum TaxID=105696 RepID=A0A1Y2M927_EPING|nr:hypothetical protein B5807_02194 [Epicoccum nigrum]